MKTMTAEELAFINHLKAEHTGKNKAITQKKLIEKLKELGLGHSLGLNHTRELQDFLKYLHHEHREPVACLCPQGVFYCESAFEWQLYVKQLSGRAVKTWMHRKDLEAIQAECFEDSPQLILEVEVS